MGGVDDAGVMRSALQTRWSAGVLLTSSSWSCAKRASATRTPRVSGWVAFLCSATLLLKCVSSTRGGFGVFLSSTGGGWPGPGRVRGTLGSGKPQDTPLHRMHV